MTQEELVSKLNAFGVSRALYDFGSYMPDTYLLGQLDGKWALYSHERGHISVEREFESEGALYAYFYDKMRRSLDSLT